MTLDQIEHQAKNRLYIDPDAILRLVADLRRYRKALEALYIADLNGCNDGPGDVEMEQAAEVLGLTRH